jgi:hypothetical protein
VKEEQREDRPLLRAAERQERSVRGDLKRAEDAEIECVRFSNVPLRPAPDKGGEARG